MAIVRNSNRKISKHYFKPVGFKINQAFAQPNNQTNEIIQDWKGLFNIFIAKKY